MNKAKGYHQLLQPPKMWVCRKYKSTVNLCNLKCVKSVLELSSPPARVYYGILSMKPLEVSLLPHPTPFQKWNAWPLQGYPVTFNWASLTICSGSFMQLGWRGTLQVKCFAQEYFAYWPREVSNLDLLTWSPQLHPTSQYHAVPLWPWQNGVGRGCQQSR